MPPTSAANCRAIPFVSATGAKAHIEADADAALKRRSSTPISAGNNSTPISAGNNSTSINAGNNNVGDDNPDDHVHDGMGNNMHDADVNNHVDYDVDCKNVEERPFRAALDGTCFTRFSA